MTNIEEKLRKWLEEQGYPLEMLVARLFQEQGASVIQSDYYIDYETGKPREIDVTAKWYQINDTLHELDELELFFFIACKSNQKDPWIIFSTGSGKKRPSLLPPTNINGRDFLKYINDQKKSKIIELLDIQKRAGYGITQGFTTKKDIPYEAVMSAVKAAIAKIIDSDAMYEEVKDDIEDGLDIYYHPVITFPVVVTDSLLFECYIDESNSIVINPTNYGVIEWKYPTGLKYSFYTITVYIYNTSALNKLMEHVVEIKEELHKNLPTRSRDNKKK